MIPRYNENIIPEVQLVAKVVQGPVLAQFKEAATGRSRPKHYVVDAVDLLRASVHHFDVLDEQLYLLIVTCPSCCILGYL